MGGELKKGNSIVSGVVPDEVRDFLKEKVKAGRFETISKAIRHYLTLAIRTSDPEFSNEIEPEDEKPKMSRLRSLWRRD